MYSFDNNWECIADSFKLDHDVAILDVDRTIINTTSWYHACVCPDLLISAADIPKFLSLNEAAFSSPPNIDHSQFRKRTLNLIEPVITEAFMTAIDSIPEWKSYFIVNTPTDYLRFFSAGLAISRKLHQYAEVITYLKFASRFYGSSLRILFLSAGYRDFIQGFVYGFLSKNKLDHLSYHVIGSELRFEPGNITESYHVDQFEKQTIIERIMGNGANVVFLADDSTDNPELFKKVVENGGDALNVVHAGRLEKNESWSKYLESLKPAKLKRRLMQGKLGCSLAEKTKQPYLVHALECRVDGIGIVSLSTSEYEEALSGLLSRVGNEYVQIKLLNAFRKMSFTKNEKTFLRGCLYYLWLPPHIFADNTSIVDKYVLLHSVSFTAFEILTESDLVGRVDQLTTNEKILVFSVFDHLIHAAVICLNSVERACLRSSNQNIDHYSELLEKEIGFLYDSLYRLFLGSSNVLRCNQRSANVLNDLVEVFRRHSDHFCGMRELDDAVRIFHSVASLAEQMQSRQISYDYLISLPYGGIELGFALRAYLKLQNIKEIPELLHSHFSSKKENRERCLPIDYSNKSWLEAFVPRKHRHKFKDLYSGNKKVLVFDHNATTFQTLNRCKMFLSQFGNQVDCVVAAVNYNNICAYLLGDESAEPLILDWKNILDYTPTDQYVTAFSTWGKSEKANLLEKLYFNAEVAAGEKCTALKSDFDPNMFIFKLCRVHNPTDLDVALRYGCNFIGIHAVFPNRYKYLKSQLAYSPMIKSMSIDPDLPLALLEIDSIKAVQKYLPEYVKQAILFEQPIRHDKMAMCCDIYGLKRENLFVQLQHRTNCNYIRGVKKMVCENIIAAVGLYQDDLIQYIEHLCAVLDPDRDYILLDLSKHQPDLINSNDKNPSPRNNEVLLAHSAPLMAKYPVRFLLADDTSVGMMNKYASIMVESGVGLAGIDIQNCVEIPANEQRYRYLSGECGPYMAKIRKSADLLNKWGPMVRSFKQNSILETDMELV